MICKNCSYDLLPTIKNVGLHVGAYCSFCGKWIKWLNRAEKEMYQHKALEKAKQRAVNLANVNSLYGKLVENNDDDEVPW